MAKLKRAATHVVIKAHQHSDKTRTVFEAVSAVFVAVETHMMFFSAVCVVWAVYDVLVILEIKGGK